MKLAVIAGLYEPYAVGGAEAVAAGEAQAAAARGDEVFVITSEPWRGRRSLRPRVEERRGIPVHRFFPLNFCHLRRMMTLPLWQRAIWRLLDVFNVHSFLTIRAILRREKPDVAHVHNANGLGYLTWRAVRAAGVPCVFRLHDLQLLEPFGTIMAGRERRIDDALHRLYQALCRFLVGSPQTVVCPSQFALRLHRERGFFPASRVEVAPNVRPALAPRARRAGPPGVLRLLYAGGLEPFKGPAFLVETVKRGLEAPFVLRLAGAGSDAARLRELTAGDPRFELLGRLEGEAFEALFFDADCLVVPSLCHDNAPTVIDYAAAAGLPVIAAAVGGIPERVDAARLYPPTDREALLALLRREARRIAPAAGPA